MASKIVIGIPDKLRGITNDPTTQNHDFGDSACCLVGTYSGISKAMQDYTQLTLAVRTNADPDEMANALASACLALRPARWALAGLP